MKRFRALVCLGWLVVLLGLLLPTVAQAKPASASALARAGATSSRAAAGNDKAVRSNVLKAFVAINGANKELYACKWKHCAKAASALRSTAAHWLPILNGLKAATKTVASGLKTAVGSLACWSKAGTDAAYADAAARAKNQSRFDHWYALYKANYQRGLTTQNRAVATLSKG
jgi:hypothetical protein